MMHPPSSGAADAPSSVVAGDELPVPELPDAPGADPELPDAPELPEAPELPGPESFADGPESIVDASAPASSGADTHAFCTHV